MGFRAVFRRRLANLIGATMGLFLAACGGGGGDGAALATADGATALTGSTAASGSTGTAGSGSTTSATAGAAAAAETLTAAQYQAIRSSGQGAAPEPAAQALAALRTADQALALAQWAAPVAGTARPSLFTGINEVVMPPLTYASARALRAAARGDSLAQMTEKLAGRIDLAPDAAAAAWQLSRVRSTAWSAVGFKMARDFLTTIDAGTAGWDLSEADFAGGGPFAAAQVAAMGSFAATNDIRLLLSHELSLTARWPTATAFDGLFERGFHDLLAVRLVRLADGVKRLNGSDFSADMLASGDLRVISLRPSSGDLTTFANHRLSAALTTAVQTLVIDGGGGAGEMLLPLGTVSLDLAVDANLSDAGVTTVFDEVNANLKGLDLLGGTYAQVRSSLAQLEIAADGLSLKAAHSLAFIFSPRNIHGPSNGVSLTISNGSFVFSCYVDPSYVWPAADLRSLFLIVVDSRGALLALSTLNRPAGTAFSPC